MGKIYMLKLLGKQIGCTVEGLRKKTMVVQPQSNKVLFCGRARIILARDSK